MRPSLYRTKTDNYIRKQSQGLLERELFCASKNAALEERI